MLPFSALGFLNLKYGLSFIDEGMYLTDAWRLTKGDDLFPDADRTIATLYHVFSQLPFQIQDNLGVLGFRRVQFFAATAVGILFFYFFYNRFILIRHNVAIILAPFFFLGFDSVGLSSSFSYYSVTVFFLLLATILEATLVDEGRRIQGTARHFCTFLLGLMVLCAGVSYLPSALIGIFFLVRIANREEQVYKQAFFFLIPATFYLSTIAINYNEFMQLIPFILYNNKDAAAGIYPYTLPYLAWASLIVSIFVSTIFLKHAFLKILISLVCLILFFFSRSLADLGILPLFYNGWFQYPGMFAALNCVLAILFIGAMSVPSKYALFNKNSQYYNVGSALLLIYFFSCLSFSLTSGLGILLFSNMSFVLWIALALLITDSKSLRIKSVKNPAVALYFCTALSVCFADYEFTYFDQKPTDLNTTIEQGPASGIVTNSVNAQIIYAIQDVASALSKPEDFILSFDRTPMTYFLAQRRPALDHSWVGITGGKEEQSIHAINKMVRHGREPTLAFHWLSSALWFPGGENAKYSFSGFSESNEKFILAYVRQNMEFVGTINVFDRPIIEVYKAKTK